jgi:hypothetical protein
MPHKKFAGSLTVGKPKAEGWGYRVLAYTHFLKMKNCKLGITFLMKIL